MASSSGICRCVKPFNVIRVLLYLKENKSVLLTVSYVYTNIYAETYICYFFSVFSSQWKFEKLHVGISEVVLVFKLTNFPFAVPKNDNEAEFVFAAGAMPLSPWRGGNCDYT